MRTLFLLLLGLTLAAPGGASGAGPGPSAFGVIPGRWQTDARGFRGAFLPDSGFGDGVYAVPLDADTLLAFDLDSPATTRCRRVGSEPVTFPFDSRAFHRCRCEERWNARNVLFAADRHLQPSEGERLAWTRAWGDTSAIGAVSGGGLAVHRYAAVARPRLLNGRALIAEAVFSGRYPPSREYDALREDSVAVGHYRVLSRGLRLEGDAGAPAEIWFRSTDPEEVAAGLDWAFLPSDASERIGALFTTLYQIPGGHLLMLVHATDHEGAGFDQIVRLFICSKDGWKEWATGERTVLY